jgi:hypothetical protein
LKIEDIRIEGTNFRQKNKKTDYRIVIDKEKPYISWLLQSEVSGTVQTAYQIKVMHLDV